MPSTHLIAATRGNYSEAALRLASATGDTFYTLHSKDELHLDLLQEIQPRYVFFPHWSYIIPAAVYEQFECVIFHPSDVPFGRGGSPVQNQIARGIYDTQMTAMRCVQELDGGDIYMKRPFSFHGAAEEIFIRAAQLIETMMLEIVQTQPNPIAQSGVPTAFRRRKPAESSISECSTLREVFDYIRMLDAEGYPYAFIETEHLRFEFSRASLKPNEILADVRITRK